VVEGTGWCSTESPTKVAAGLVLCHLEGLNQAFLSNVSEPNGGAIGENGKNYHEVDFMPIGEVQSSDRIT
jgi:hypothetical protein